VCVYVVRDSIYTMLSMLEKNVQDERFLSCECRNYLKCRTEVVVAAKRALGRCNLDGRFWS
jgi:hypothetical protein